MTSSPATHFQLSLWAGAGSRACHTRRLEQDGTWWRRSQQERSSDPTRIEKTLGRRELVITGCIGQPLLLSPSHYQVILVSLILILPGWCSGVRSVGVSVVSLARIVLPAMQVSSNEPLHF